MPSRSVTATTTKQLVAPYMPRRTAIMLHNRGAVSVFVAHDPGTGTGQDWEVPAGVVFSLARTDGDEPELPMYLTADSGTPDVRIWESYGEARQPRGVE